jgi:hypothetical protein
MWQQCVGQYTQSYRHIILKPMYRAPRFYARNSEHASAIQFKTTGANTATVRTHYNFASAYARPEHLIL